jgi:hypothetical protein
MPQYIPLRSLWCSRESLRCFFACRLCHGSCAQHYRMVPSQKLIISIWTLGPHCLISTCEIPANLPYNIRGLDHRVGHVSHAERRQSPQAPYPAGTLERGLGCPHGGAWHTERKDTRRGEPCGRSKVTENL